MSAVMGLFRTQGLFWDLITAPEGVRPGLQGLVGKGEAEPGDLEALIAAGGRLEPADRLDIYDNMYFYRLLEALQEDFPRLLEAVGPARFHNLVTDYLLRHPSSNPSLRHLGERLPGFVEKHALGSESPVLADLARLEWARADLFDRADAAPLTRERLARLPQDRAGEARLTLVPAFALLRLEHDAPRLWRGMRERAAAGPTPSGGPAPSGAAESASGTTCAAGQANAAPDAACSLHREAEPETPLPESPRRRTYVRVWRQGFTVYHRTIVEDEAGALELVTTGAPIARIAQRLAAGRSTTKATERFGSLLQTWIDDGLLADAALPA